MKILIVDDVRLVRELEERHLKQYGSCETAQNGHEAISMIKTAFKLGTPYNLILLDILMPVTDGFEVIKTVRSIERENKVDDKNRCRIIIISALKTDDEVKKAIELGCDDYMLKPIQLQLLKSKLKKFQLIN